MYGHRRSIWRKFYDWGRIGSTWEMFVGVLFVWLVGILGFMFISHWLITIGLPQLGVIYNG